MAQCFSTYRKINHSFMSKLISWLKYIHDKTNSKKHKERYPEWYSYKLREHYFLPANELSIFPYKCPNCLGLDQGILVTIQLHFTIIQNRREEFESVNGQNLTVNTS